MIHRPTENERLEIVQDVIDRLVFLPDEELKKYLEFLNKLKGIYPITVTIENGVRVYPKTVNTSTQS
jgi:hypothetical protein